MSELPPTSSEQMPTDVELRWLEYKQRQAELERLSRIDLDQRTFNEKSLRLTRRSAFWGSLISSLTVLVSAAAVVIAVVSATQSTEHADQQFQATRRAEYFKSIIDGLGSQSAAVQATSIRLLTAYEMDTANFGGDIEARNKGISDELRTLSAFIRDATLQRAIRPSGEEGTDVSDYESVGLSDYSVSLPIIIDRAMDEVKRLTSDKGLGLHGIDLSSANLHGISLEGYRSTGKFTADAADLRRADLSYTNFSSGASFNGAFLTCANLEDADLGTSSVNKADFFGANLSGADLSKVQGLESRQLAGVTTSSGTRLPDGIAPPAVPPVGYNEPPCTMLVDKMTGIEPNMGYAVSMPCPSDVNKWPQNYPVLARFSGNRQYLVDVCGARG